MWLSNSNISASVSDRDFWSTIAPSYNLDITARKASSRSSSDASCHQSSDRSFTSLECFSISLLNLVIFCLSLLLSKLSSRIYLFIILLAAEEVQWIFSDRYPVNNHKHRYNRKNTTESKKKNDPIVDFRPFHKLSTPYINADTMICMRVVISSHQSQEMQQTLSLRSVLFLLVRTRHNNRPFHNHCVLYLDREILLIQIYPSLPYR